MTNTAQVTINEKPNEGVDLFSCPVSVDDPIPKDNQGNPIGLTRCQRIEICKDINILKGYVYNRDTRDIQYRISAAESLSEIFKKEAGELLRYLMKDPDWKVKKKARKLYEKRNEKLKQWKVNNGTWKE